MKKLKVIQIGMGHDHADVVLDSLLRQPEVFEVVGFAVPECEKVKFSRNIQKYSNLGVKLYPIDEIFDLEGLDAAIIETEELNLTKYAQIAADYGLHVHMDKPGGTELSDFKKLISTVKNRNQVFHLGYMYRYNPAVMKLMEDIKNGVLGEVYSVEAHMNCMHPPEKRQWLEQFKGGQMFFLGCHLVDLIYRILGEPLEVLPLSCSTGIDGVTAEDYGMAVFKYKNGLSFAKTCAIEPNGFLRRQLVVCGSKGTVQLLPLEGYAEGIMQYTDVRECNDNGDGDIFDWHKNGENYRCEEYNRYDLMMYSFAQYVNGEKENPYTYDYELRLYKLVLRACGVAID